MLVNTHQSGAYIVRPPPRPAPPRVLLCPDQADTTQPQQQSIKPFELSWKRRPTNRFVFCACGAARCGRARHVHSAGRGGAGRAAALLPG